MQKIKLLVAIAFLAFAGTAFFFSSGKSYAQSEKVSERRDPVLENIAGYKLWKQVQKPETNSDLSFLKSDVLTISDSSVAG